VGLVVVAEDTVNNKNGSAMKVLTLRDEGADIKATLWGQQASSKVVVGEVILIKGARTSSLQEAPPGCRQHRWGPQKRLGLDQRGHRQCHLPQGWGEGQQVVHHHR